MIRGIIMIVIDCLRADHVSCYGYHRQTTPTIDALAERGILWEHAHSASSWTKPSVTSILTGLYPTQHGAFEGIKKSKGRTAVTTDVLDSALPTLAETLTAAGWRCGAFINNGQLGEFTRLNRGFASYAPQAGKADRLIGIFLEWLEAGADKPFFGYLHLLEAHYPYKPRRRHVAMFGGDRDTNHFRDFSARDYGKLRRDIAHGDATLSDDHLTQMLQMYDAAVRRLDGKIRIILAMLTELGLRDTTAVIVTADHGEEFLDHGRIGHGQALYNELTHVPLIAHIPDAPGGVRNTELVSHVDLARTLAGLAGVDGELPGTNLATVPVTPRTVCTELRIRRRYTQTIRTPDWKLHRRFKFEPPDAGLDQTKSPRAWVTMYPHTVKLELYDMTTDPTEQVDLADNADHAATRDDLVAKLDRWWHDLPDAAGTDSAEEVEIDPRVVERLRDLGYID